MSSRYWSQWSGAELMSMQGVELDDIDTDLFQDDHDADLDQYEDEDMGCCSNGCMSCLGLSLSDFM